MSLGDLVLSLADNKQLLALRYAEWATSGPSLEADIAAAGMGLDDLGHSRVLLGCAEALGDSARQVSGPTDYYNLPYLDAPWPDWSWFVAANAVLDTAFTLMIQAMVEGNVEVLRSRLRKMAQEERYHFLHGRSWLREGIDARPLDEAWRQAVAWFGPPDGEVAELAAAGQLSRDPEALGRLLEERLEMPAPELTVEWSRWDPRRRRDQPGGIDQPTFEMLRGLEERRFAAAAG